MQNNKEYSENLIKGRIAETIIQELFIQSGYNVFHYGMERTLPAILGKISGKNDAVSTAIRSMPDFVVQNTVSGALFYVEVKYRSSGEFRLKDLMKNYPYENAHFILVSTDSIKHITFHDLKEGAYISKNDDRHLQSCAYFTFDKDILKQYLNYVTKFYMFFK